MEKNSHHPLFWCVALLLFVMVAQAAFAARPPTRAPLENFDRRKEQPVAGAAVAKSAASASTTQAEATIRARVPGVKIERPAGRHSPRYVGSTKGFLTGPAGEGRSVNSARAASIPKDDPHRGLKAFLDEHRGAFGHDSGPLRTAAVKRDDTHGRLRTTVWQQELDGIPVFGAVLKSCATVDGELVNIASGFVPDLAKAATKDAPDRAARLAAPTVTAQAAVAIAAKSIGEDIAAGNVVPSDQPVGAEKKRHCRAPRVLDVTAELIWLPLDDDTLRLCWQVHLMSKARGEMFKVIVDAETGEALVRHGLTNYITDATYRVFTSDSPSPLSPGHATPLTTQPPEGTRSLLILPALDVTASPNGWIDDGVNETRGNNVDAHTDIDGNNVADQPRTQAAPGRVFDFPLDLSQEPGTYRDAAVTQLFYWCNWMHDKLYALGFTEAAGNFQSNNFGRGGIGNDAVQADAQDGSGTNNANFSTPGDGGAGRMQMYLFTAPTPDRDGSLDAEIVLHEYTHGLSNRLVGGGVGISELQTAGMGEGWSDFYALALLSEPTDDVNGNYAAVAYSTYRFGGGTANYYFGIRRYPYSTDPTKNPLTFKDIDPAQQSSHPGVPRGPIGGSSGSEVHNQGEVWCVALWEARANLITKLGHAVGNQLILQLVTDGMKLAPANPTFLQARDAIIQADLVLTGGANHRELWAAFAKRGMGASAQAPASSTTAGVVEAFDLPDVLNISPNLPVTTNGPAGGPFGQTSASFTLTNTDTSTVSWTASADVAWLTLSHAGGSLNPGANAVVTATLNAAAQVLPAGVFTGTLTFQNTTTGLSQMRTYTLKVGQPDFFTEHFDTSPNDTSFQSFTFTPDGSGSYYAATREGATALPTSPIGGTSLSLSDDSFAAVTLSGGATVSIYGTSYDSFFVGSNGYVTFGAGDTVYQESFAAHFGFRRVAAFYNDLNPAAGGVISWRQLGDRVAITYLNVPEYGIANLNSFQIELFFDGRIRITILGVAPSGGLIGLSNGTGLSPGFSESDFSSYPAVAQFVVSIPATAMEGDAAPTGTVTLSPAPAANLSVNLTSSNPARATVPASVVIPSGQSSVSFPLTVVNDTILNGTATVSITASAPAHTDGVASISIFDNETTRLTVSVPASTVEGAVSVQGTVSLSAVAGTTTAVTLSSSNTAAVLVPATVLIPGGQTSATFAVTVVDDSILDGTQMATITAHVENWADGVGTIAVLDNEGTTISLTVPASVIEGTPAAGTVALGGTTPTARAIALTSSNPTQISVPLTVTIPAGSASAAFIVTAVNDTATDGSQAATITASSAGLTSGTANVTAIDNEVSHFTFSPIAPVQIRDAPFPITATARNIDGIPITNFSGTVFFSASGSAGSVPVSPISAGGFVNGEWLGNIAISEFASDVVVTVNDGAGHTGASNAFSVSAGSLHHFGWSVIPSPQIVGTPFAVTVTAQDVAGNTVTSYSGLAELSGFVPNPAGSTVVISEVNPNTPDEIEFMNVSTAAVDVSGWTIHVYDEDTWPAALAAITVPPGSVCGAGEIFRLREFGSDAGSFPLLFVQGNINWTSATGSHVAVLLRDASGAIVDFVCAAAGAPEPINSPVAIPPEHWLGLPITAPSNGSFAYARAGEADDNSAANWVTTAASMGTVNPGLIPPFPSVVLPVSVMPGSTGTFIGGVWSGTIAAAQSVSGVKIRATSTLAIKGDSNSFDVVGTPTLSVTPAEILAVTGNFGGPFAPASTTYTLTNTADGVMAWSAGSNASWLTLAPAAGVLPPGQSITMTATIAAGTLDPGTDSATLTFTNHTNGIGSTSRTVQLTVVLPAPELVKEPVFSGGLSNTLTWAPSSGAQSYEIQRATVADFSDATAPIAIQTTEHTFAGLSENVLYHYRVRARRSLPGDFSVWTQSTQADFSASSATDVTATGGDDVILTPGVGGLYPAAGTLVSPVIAPQPLHAWDLLQFTSDVSNPGTVLTVDVLSASGTLLAANVPSGTNLESLPAVAAQPSIKLRANLTTTVNTVSPRLEDWTVFYKLAAPVDAASDWSAPQSSTQDATGPVVAILSPTFTLSNPASLHGSAIDAAGVNAVRINGVLASNANAFATWSGSIGALVPGTNALTLTATDNAVPPNVTTQQYSLYFATMTLDADGDALPDAWEAARGLNFFDAADQNGALGDANHNGVPNLLEYAFGADLAGANGLLPVLTVETNPLDGFSYATLRYHRLLIRGPLSYTLELSPDLAQWHTALAADFEEILPPVADPGGLTETVNLRLKPAISGVVPAIHSRIRVSAPQISP